MSAESGESRSRSGSARKAPRKKAVQLTDDQAIELLADGFVAGREAACKRWQVSIKTYWRLSRKVSGSPALASALAAKKEEREREYRREILRTALKGLARMETLFETETDLKVVAGATHLLLDKLIARDILGGNQQPRPHRKDPPPSTAGGAAPAGGPGASVPPPVH